MVKSTERSERVAEGSSTMMMGMMMMMMLGLGHPGKVESGAGKLPSPPGSHSGRWFLVVVFWWWTAIGDELGALKHPLTTYGLELPPDGVKVTSANYVVNRSYTRRHSQPCPGISR